jgi:polyisoprenoid-binding protein YceI
MKRTPFVLTSLALVALLAACNNDPGKDKAKAQVAEAVTTQTNAAAAPGASTQTLKFSQDGSKIAWVGAKFSGKHDGGFATFAGTITLVDNNPEKSQVSVDIDLGSVTSDQEKLTGHLKSDAFFDTAKFPKAKFASTSIKVGGENGATHTVTGNLTLRDVTKSISFPATIKLTATGADVDADFAINRKDFGILYAGKADDLIKDAVNLKLTVRARK